MTDTHSSPDPAPYHDPATNRIYNLLFCDDFEMLKNDDPQKIIDSPDNETRPKILAYNKLRTLGKTPAKKELLGVVIEMGLDEGMDTLAAYKDGTARYINCSESMLMWDTVTPESKKLTDQLLKEGENIIKKIGPWDKPRLASPPLGEVRLTFLVSDGLYFGQGPIDVMFNDEMAGPVLDSATHLMEYLTNMTLGKPESDEK